MQIYKFYLNARKGDKKTVKTKIKIVKEEPERVFIEENLTE
jgi:hypothetical protein